MRGRWAPPLTEGKGLREGHRMAISRQLPGRRQLQTRTIHQRRHANPRPPPLSKQRQCSSYTGRSFREFSHRGFCNRSYCVLRVLSDTLVLRCTMVMLCVKEADQGMMALVAEFAIVHHVFPHVPLHSVTREQRPCPSSTRRWSRRFLAIYRCLDRGRGVTTLSNCIV